MSWSLADIDPPPLWRWCSGSGTPAVEASTHRRRWWRCSTCGRVSWWTRKVVDEFTLPRHMAPVER